MPGAIFVGKALDEDDLFTLWPLLNQFLPKCHVVAHKFDYTFLSHLLLQIGIDALPSVDSIFCLQNFIEQVIHINPLFSNPKFNSKGK